MSQEMNQEEKLRQEILNEAKARADRALARACNEAETMLNAASSQLEAERKKRLEEVRKEAVAAGEAKLQETAFQCNAAWIRKREQEIDRFLQDAADQCKNQQGEARERSYRALFQEAAGAMGAVNSRVLFPASCSAFITEEWIRTAAAELFGGNLPVYTLVPSTDASAGIQMVSEDGQMSFDNTYQTRLENMKEQLRAMLLQGNDYGTADHR